MWLKEIKEKDTHGNYKIIVVGNKTDLEEKREVTKEESENYAKQQGLLYFEVSAKNNSNVQEIFLELASVCWKECVLDI